MRTVSTLIACSGLLILAACGGGETSTDTSNSAEDFAARINGGSTSEAPQAPHAPTVAKPLSGAAGGAYVPGTLTDPESAICGANLMEPYIGKPADEPTRSEIMNAASNASQVRFVLAGSATVQPDPTNPRLNIMIDNLGIIRDARCG